MANLLSSGLYDEMDKALSSYNSTVDTYVIVLIVFFCLFAAAAAAFMIGFSLNLKKRAEGQRAVNAKVMPELRANGFEPTRIFYFCDRATFKKTDDCKQMLAVNSERRQLALIDYESGSWRVVDFADLLNYEVYENGTMVAEGAGIGGFGLGVFGMQTNHICKELRLIIRVKSADRPQTVYPIISSKGILNFGVGKNSQIYRACFPTVQEAVSLLQVILNENKEEAS